MLFNEFDIMLFGFVCGVVVLQIVCQWILEGDFKCILKGKTALIISVLAAGGILAGEFAFGGSGAQAKLLKKEGVIVENGRVDLKKYGIII